MTDAEQKELDEWLEAIRSKQPTKGTLCIPAWVRDGKVVVDRSFMKDFPSIDLMAVRRMIDKFLDEKYEEAVAQMSAEDVQDERS